MKPKFIILLALLSAGTVRGQFIFLSESQSVSASATASVHQISSNFNYTADSGSLGGGISVTDPNPDQYGNSGESAFANGTASLETAQSAGQIACDSRVTALGYGPFDQSSGGAIAVATSVFQVSFSVSSPQLFQMSADIYSLSRSAEETYLNFSFSLSSANQGFICGWGNEVAGELPFPIDPFSGVLEPGDVYTLQDSMEAGGNITDPLTELTTLGAGVSLTAVPEPSSGVVMGMGAMRLMLMRRRVRPAPRLQT